VVCFLRRRHPYESHQVELCRSQTPIPLPEPWAPAWWEPSGKPFTSLDFAFYKVYTDEGIVGIGPYTGGNPAALALGVDPFQVGGFWQRHMSGARSENAGKGAAGLELALWDIVGKAAGLPLYKLMGAGRNRTPVYAAVSRLLEPERQIEQIEEIIRRRIQGSQIADAPAKSLGRFGRDPGGA
jgi:galactonate dehydratase